MKLPSIVKSVLTVSAGVVVAGYALNLLRDVDFFRNVTRGFDS